MNTPFRFLHYKLYKNPLEDWLLALGIIAISIILARAIYWVISSVLLRITKHTATELDDLIIKRIDTPAALCIILVGFRLALEQLQFSATVEKYLLRGFVLMTALAITWLITRVIRAGIEHYFAQYGTQNNTFVDLQMMALAKRTSLILVWTIGIIVGLNNAGFDVGALIAGLGIGGLAIALAAQDTVKNIIGGLIVFFDKPFKVGDVVKVKEVEGTVSYTGIRSTRIRTGAGRLVIMPNAQFTDSAIENITMEPAKRVVTYLSLTYETPSEKIDEAINILKDISLKTDALNGRDSVAFLEKFSASSIEINFTYFIRKNVDAHDAQTEVNKAILHRFREAGIEFAYPTQTVIEKK